MKYLYSLFFAGVLSSVGMMSAEQKIEDLNTWYSLFDADTDQFLATVKSNPTDVKKTLSERKALIELELNNLSYKNVLLSAKNIANMSGLIAGIASYTEKFPVARSMGQYIEQVALRDARFAKELVAKGMKTVGYILPAQVAVVAGLGLYADIKKMISKKNTLTIELKKINTMLSLMEAKS